MMPDVQLYHGDCLEEMARIPDGSVDMILADLPYGTTACKWDSVIPFAPLWEHYRRVIKRNGAIVLTAQQPFTSALVMSNPDWFRYEYVIDKGCTTGWLNARKMPMKRHETAVVFYGALPTYNPQTTKGKTHGSGGGKDYSSDLYRDGFYSPKRSTDVYQPHSIITLKPEAQVTKVHPTQKPVALGEYLIRTYTNEGETVLDNTMGSGSFGVAAMLTGRNFVGIERDEKYYAIAMDRIEQARESLASQLFEAAP